MVVNAKEQVFWTSINSVPAQYPWITENIECEVAIIGGGITAALCALRFAQAGYDTVMVGASPIGFGATSTASGMMSIDGEQAIASLVDEIGADRAMMAVGLKSQALDNIEKMCGEFDDNCGFKRMDSLRYTPDAKNASFLRREYSLRLHNKIDTELITKLNSAEQFTFPIEAGVYSKGAGAQIDPYRFVHAVVSKALGEGARIYENTAVHNIDKDNRDYLILECQRERQIRCKYAIVAAGLETEEYVKGIDRTVSICTVVTEPLSDFPGWRGSCLIYSEGSPMVFLTVTPDNRIMISGLANPSVLENPYFSRLLDMIPVSERRYEQLEKKLRSMFPAIRNITVEYVYTSRNGRTEDGLPVIGKKPDDERIAYALCCGADGILYSEIASRLLLDQYEGKANREMGLFSPGREWRVLH